MVLLQLLLVLGLSCAAFAECLHPATVDNFDMEKFAGRWFYGAMDALNQIEATSLEQAKCGSCDIMYDKEDVTKNTWEVDLQKGTHKSDLGGTFSLPDANKGLIKLYYKVHNFTYDSNILCTDYTTYYGAYSCAQVTPQYKSEVINLNLRNPSAYNEVIAKKEVQDCYKSVMQKPVAEIKRIPYPSDCPARAELKP